MVYMVIPNQLLVRNRHVVTQRFLSDKAERPVGRQ